MPRTLISGGAFGAHHRAAVPLRGVAAYLKRLVSSLAAYQLADVISRVIAVLLLPVYTRYISPAGYGVVELLVTGVILISILARLGMIEAFLRFYFVDEEAGRRDALVRRTAAFLIVATTLAAGALALAAGPVSQVVLGYHDVTTFRIAVLGLWTFTNLEFAYAVLRVDERLRLYATASVTNVLLTVAGSLILVVGAHDGARGLLLGNYGASTVVLLGLWFTLRQRLRPRRGRRQRLPELLRFGLPTLPAEASVYLLSMVDRYYLFHVRSPRTAGLYSIAIKLAGGIAFLVRAFQYAWPPLAYSVADDLEAGRLYGLVTTYYLLVSGWAVAGLTLLGRWILRLLTTHAYLGADRAVPWVALGWAFYGLWVVFLTIAGRAKVTTRNFPAALVGLATNVILLLVLVPPLGLAGAGIALCGAYVFMLGFMHLLTRNQFAVQFEWLRLAQLALVMGGLAALGDILLPTHGAVGLLSRLLVLGAIGPALLLVGFVHEAELRQARVLAGRLRHLRTAPRGTP
jgi:O-antigen/teichoic acid export membrane protein